MPIKESGKKELRKSRKRAIHNKEIKEDLKSLIKQTRKAVETKEAEKVTNLLQKACKALDKATQKNIIKANTAARKKSRLAKRVNAIKEK